MHSDRRKSGCLTFSWMRFRRPVHRWAEHSGWVDNEPWTVTFVLSFLVRLQRLEKCAFPGLVTITFFFFCHTCPSSPTGACNSVERWRSLEKTKIIMMVIYRDRFNCVKNTNFFIDSLTLRFLWPSMSKLVPKMAGNTLIVILFEAQLWLPQSPSTSHVSRSTFFH